MKPSVFPSLLTLFQPSLVYASSEIIGGIQAALGEFPHQASLRYGGSHICGGSIIAPTKILTAAHCVYRMNTNNFQVATGTTSVSGGQLHRVVRIVSHPDYNARQGRNDVSVLTLAAPIQYNQYQRPIPLTTSPPAAGQRASLSGWGSISTNGPLANYLLKMDKSVVGLNQCQMRRSDVLLDNSHLCTLDRGSIGACQGDSGGPLIRNGEQIGITS